MRVSKRCIISGKVQGVFFRQGTFQKATALGIKGWVRNLSTGEVECYLCGDSESVEALVEWLWEGPSAARVDDVQVKDADWQEFETFLIKR